MNESSLRPPFAKSLFRLPLLLLAAMFLASDSFILKRSAAQSCNPPLDPTIHGWAPYSVVYYDISALPAAIRPQAISAFNKWSAANQSNGSGVVFQAASASHPATYTVQVGPVDGDPAGSAVSRTNSGVVTSTTTTVDVENTNIYDPAQPGYDTIFEKMMLHERAYDGHNRDARAEYERELRRADGWGQRDEWKVRGQ